ncbi:MAG: phenylalanine--tRNA ligase subunit alpha [Mycoplasma sp.]|nr:phenylalanine--tRNA ligase subunit alpha [Mycoplasma sp.]
MNIEKLIKDIKSFEDLKNAKAKFFGKNGIISEMQQKLRTLPNEEKSNFGKEINKIKTEANDAFQQKKEDLEKERLDNRIKNEWLDVTEPISSDISIHPLTQIINRVRAWFLSNGYFEFKVNEIESDKYNFEHLNISKDHPARDMQDSLYINESLLLRTHNTGASARMMEASAPNDVATFTIGKVYRNDDDDSTHSHQFMQCDFVNVGDVNFPSLISTLKSMLSFVFEEDLEIRLRPSYFPFTEPSMEVDIFYKGKWLEVLGSGMIHPNVLEKAGYEKNKIAFAAGVGIERLAMIKYGIKDIRDFYTNDKRFLNQFKEIR